jgi:hypothetical protein
MAANLLRQHPIGKPFTSRKKVRRHQMCTLGLDHAFAGKLPADLDYVIGATPALPSLT